MPQSNCNSLIMTPDQIQLFTEQIEICFKNVEWTHKIHEKSADIFSAICNWKSWIELICSFIVGWDVLSQMRSESPVISVLLVICSAVLAFSSTVSKAFNFENRRDQHISTANSLWEVRESYRSFKTDLATGLYSVDTYMTKRDQLQKITSEIYKKAPRTFNKAYNRADKDFKNGKVTFDL